MLSTTEDSTMRKKENKITVIISIIFVIMIIGIGYAYFNTSLIINGISKLNGTFNIVFDSAFITNQTEIEEIYISEDGLNLSFSVDLAMPGESDIIHYTITNKGTIDATLEELVVTSTDDSDVTFNCSSIQGDLLSGNSISGTITVTWNSDSYSAQKDVSFNAYIEANQKI